MLLAASHLEDLFELVDREALQIHALLFIARIIEDDQVRVMVRDPLHIRVLPILPPLLLLEIPLHLCIRRLVEPSGGTALEAKLGAGFEILGIGIHDEAVSGLRAAIFERDGHDAVTRGPHALLLRCHEQRGEQKTDRHGYLPNLRNGTEVRGWVAGLEHAAGESGCRLVAKGACSTKKRRDAEAPMRRVGWRAPRRHSRSRLRTGKVLSRFPKFFPFKNTGRSRDTHAGQHHSNR